MRASVVLATLCFFWVTLHTSSIRAEESWKKVEVGPDKGSYKGSCGVWTRLQGLKMIKSLSNLLLISSIPL